MKVIKAANYVDLSKKAAALIAAQIIRDPSSVLGLATGSTPVGVYSELAELCGQGVIDFACVTTVNLDEYCGLPAEHPQSYAQFMRQKLFDHVNIAKSNTHLPDGMAKDAEVECLRYERLIEGLGGIDLQLLGIGRNGHIGFNEPGESFAPGTHQTGLAKDTLDANSRFFGPGEKVPTQAFSMGIGTIMRARSILLIASGSDKTWALDKTINGPVTPQVPASVLQFHRDVTVIYCD
ncbi:MAG: glucosamine-6-phosphate deaminase [Oscillospiraceae bacterium]|nr:glucosamine-6-phosphate deaminase [Oscillospiraceae bacterium]